jgi:hypothetical protein
MSHRGDWAPVRHAVLRSLEERPASALELIEAGIGCARSVRGALRRLMADGCIIAAGVAAKRAPRGVAPTRWEVRP